MAVQITYFVHGTTTDNQNKISSWRYDVELSELGAQQGIDLKGLIDITSFDAVFCSDLKRAVDSANLTFEKNVPIIIDARLRECNYGDFNAKPNSIVEPMCEWECITVPFPNGESYEDVKARVQSFLDDLKEKYDGKHIAIVAHKAPQLVLDVILKDMTRAQALEKDRRKRKTWQAGREYNLL